jgi:hypothetical protein
MLAPEGIEPDDGGTTLGLNQEDFRCITHAGIEGIGLIWDAHLKGDAALECFRKLHSAEPLSCSPGLVADKPGTGILLQKDDGIVTFATTYAQMKIRAPIQPYMSRVIWIRKRWNTVSGGFD